MRSVGALVVLLLPWVGCGDAQAWSVSEETARRVAGRHAVVRQSVDFDMLVEASVRAVAQFAAQSGIELRMVNRPRAPWAQIGVVSVAFKADAWVVLFDSQRSCRVWVPREGREDSAGAIEVAFHVETRLHGKRSGPHRDRVRYRHVMDRVIVDRVSVLENAVFF